MSNEEKKPLQKSEYLDIEQLYKIAAQSGTNITINVIKDSEVTIHNEQHIQINIGTIIQDVENLSISSKRKTEIIQCINEVQEQVEKKADWDKIVSRITILLNFGKEGLPLAAKLLQWIMEHAK